MHTNFLLYKSGPHIGYDQVNITRCNSLYTYVYCKDSEKQALIYTIFFHFKNVLIQDIYYYT
jgi:hypothetical protein